MGKAHKGVFMTEFTASGLWPSMLLSQGERQNMSINKKSGNSVEFPDEVIIYKGELEYIFRYILDYPNIETGGDLFGVYTTSRVPFIRYVLGPGKDAQHNPAHFRQDETFFNRNADMLIKEHNLYHIGTWHSHHSLGIDHPSGGDNQSMFYGMEADGLESFLLVIGTIDDRKSPCAKAYSFSLSRRKYSPSQWVVLNEESPIRQQFDKKHRDIICLPHTAGDITYQIESIPLYDEAAKKVYPQGYWLNEQSNNAEVKRIINYLKQKYKKVSLYLQAEDKILEIIIEDIKCEILFPKAFPNVPPVINSVVSDDSNWEKPSSISEGFIKYFERRKRV
jgi:hypothetical protein